MTRITIVTPSLNQGQFLPQALASVREQGIGDIEHLIFDGGSNDSTVPLLRSLRDQPGWSYLRWQSGADGGQSDALNRGFTQAQGEIIGWLNADDRYVAGCFEHVLGAFAEDSSLDVLYGDIEEIDEQGSLRRVRREIGFSRFVLFYHHVLYIPTPATFFRRRVFTDGNRLMPELHYAMDYEFFLRLSQHGYRIGHIPKVLAQFRVHDAAKSSRMRRQQAEEKRRILHLASPLARRIGSPFVRGGVLFALSVVAAAMRRLRKAAHIFRPNAISNAALAKKGGA